MARDMPTFFLDKCSPTKECTFKGVIVLANLGNILQDTYKVRGKSWTLQNVSLIHPSKYLQHKFFFQIFKEKYYYSIWNNIYTLKSSLIECG